MPENGLLKSIRTNGEKRLVRSFLISYREQLKESKLHDNKVRMGLPSNHTIRLEAQIETCEKLLGI